MNFRSALLGLMLLTTSCSNLEKLTSKFTPSSPTRVTSARPVMLKDGPAVCYTISDPRQLLGYGKRVLFFDKGFDGTLDLVEDNNSGKKPIIIEEKKELEPYHAGFDFAKDAWPSHTMRHPRKALTEEYDLMIRTNRN